MAKALCYVGFITSLFVLLVFGADLAIGSPFNGASKLMDISFVICSGILGYLSWTTLREQV